MSRTFRKYRTGPSLDRTDHRIVGLLQENSRRSNKEMAAACGIADSTLSARLRRLENAGVVRGYRADINPDSLGIGLQAIVAIRLHTHNRAAIGAFWAHTRDLPEAIRVFHVTGPNDFLVHVVVADIHHLQAITSDVLTTWPEVARLETSIVYDQREQGALPDFRIPNNG
jgi:DNA-binding Lrp family transcriptional regulator